MTAATMNDVLRAADHMADAWDSAIVARDAAPTGPMKASLRRIATCLEDGLRELDTELEEIGLNDVPNHTAIGVEDVPWKATHTHLKTGGKYRVLLMGTIEADMTPAVIYDNAEGVVWVRPETEFFDGRFEPVLPENPDAE